MNHRICFIGAEIAPTEQSTFVGGHVNTAVGLCKGLSNLGWEMHVVTTPSRLSGETKFSFPWARFHLINARGQHNSLKYAIDFFLKAVRTTINLNENHPFDLIHAHSGYFALASIPVEIKRRIGMPALFSLYCPAALYPSKFPWEAYGIKILSSNLDKLISVSNNVKKSLLTCGIREDKIETIPPCINEERFNSLVPPLMVRKKAKMKSAKANMVLFVGNADKTKGLDIFLSAAESVLRKSPGTKFVITLHEPFETIQRVRRAVIRRLGPSTTIKGVVHDMAGLMARADIVVVPFRSTEGISDVPLVVLEAMAIGKPVVASKLKGVEEVILNEHNGFVVDPGRSDQLANTIMILLENPDLRQKIGQRAVSILEKFSNFKVSRVLNDLYLKIIRNSC